MKNSKKSVILLTICFGALIGCSSAKETAPEISAPTETAMQSETIISNDTTENNVIARTEKTNEGSSDIPGNILAENDQDVPYVVLQEAEAWAAEEFEYAKRVSPGNHYSDWRIESREHCYTYEDFEGMVLQVYRMNIQFLSDMPEEVFLVGGMTMTEDGWVVPDYPNSRYLIFQQDNEALTFLTRMFENDCEAGDDTFTRDLEHQLALNEQSQPTAPTLTFVLEGESYTVPAVLIERNNYLFYLPDGEWYPTDFENWTDIDDENKEAVLEAWTQWDNEDVRIWIACFKGKSVDSAEEDFINSGYALMNDRIFRQDGEMIYGVTLKESKTDTWGICYCYPIDAEEGWGTRIQVIADTLEIAE